MERSGTGCAKLVADLCKTERVKVPPALEQVATEESAAVPGSTGTGNLLDTAATQVDMPTEYAGSEDVTLAVPRERSLSSRPSTSGLRPQTTGFRSSVSGLRPASSAALGSSAFSARRGGSSFAPNVPTSSGGLGDPAFDEQRREVELKLRRLELERIAAEEEAERLSREEALEMQRRIVEEQRQLLEQQKADLEQKLQAEKKAVEEERKILSSERKRLDQESAALRNQIEQQETNLESEKLKQQYEFQKFLEERKKWEQEKEERHQKHLLELQEAQERLYLEENKVSKQIEADRRALDASAAELAEKQAQLQREIQNKESTHTAEIEAERQQIEEQRKNLEARLKRQTLDLDDAQRQVEEARLELQERAEAMQREAAEKEKKREQELQQHRDEIEAARAALQQQEQALREAREQQERELHEQFATEQQRLDEAAARLAQEVEQASGAAEATASAMQAAVDEERVKLSEEAKRKEEDLQRLRKERQELEDEREKLKAAHNREEEQRKARELADTEALRAREHEIEELKTRLAAEEEQRRNAVTRREAEVEAMLAKERASLAEERQRIERARESGGAVAADVERDRAELESLRQELEQRSKELEERDAQQQQQREAELQEQQRQLEAQQDELARRQTEFEQEQADLRSRVDAEKLRLTEIEEARQAEEQKLQKEEEEYTEQIRKRAAEFAALESAEEAKLEELRKRVSAEEDRLATEREKIAAIERENEFNLKVTQQTRDDFNEDAGEAIKKHDELRGLLAEIKRQQRKRVATIAVGFLLLSTAGTFAAVKGFPHIKEVFIPGSKLAATFEKESSELASVADWPALLKTAVSTDERFAENRDKFGDQYTEMRPALIEAVKKSVTGILGDLSEGKEPQFDKIALLASLKHTSEWEPTADKKLLAAKLQLKLAIEDKGATATEAVDRYVEACMTDSAFAEQLSGDVQEIVGMLDEEMNTDQNVSRADELIAALERVPEASYAFNPAIVLVSGKLQADSSRKKGMFDKSLKACIDTAQSKHAGNNDWKAEMRPSLDRVLSDLEQIPDGQELSASVVQFLTFTAEFWQIPRPYMVLSDHAKAEQKKFDWAGLAAKLGDLGARAYVGWIMVTKPPTAEIRLQGERMIKESAQAENPTGLFYLSSIVFDYFSELNYPTRDFDKALSLARRAHELGHPDAEFLTARILVEKGHFEEDNKLYDEALPILKRVAEQGQHPLVYYYLGLYYFHQVNGVPVDTQAGLVELRKGQALNEVNSMILLAAYEPSPTEQCELRLRLWRDHQHEASQQWLKIWSAGADRTSDERVWINKFRKDWE